MATVEGQPRPSRKSRARSERSTSADPVDIAMAAAAAPGPAADAAQRLLETHERLALTQTALTKNELLRARIRTARDFSIALIALALLAGLALLVIGASRSRAVVIEAFSVPQELAARGLTGEVMAQRFLDRLGMIQRNADSVRTPASFANAWTGDLRVQIPSTGISMGEASRTLRRWLGSETYVSGEIFRTDTGFAVTVRTAGQDPIQAAGSASEIDQMLNRTAEGTFEQQQPYLFAIYLDDQGKLERSLAISQRLARSGDATERAWGYNAWGLRLSRMGRFEEGAARLRAGVQLDPSLPPLHFNLAIAEMDRGRDGRAPALLATAAQRYSEAAERRTLKADAVESVRAAIEAIRAQLTADHQAAAAFSLRLLQLINYTQSHLAAPRMGAIAYAQLHRPSEARALLLVNPVAPEQLQLLTHQGSIGELVAEARYRIAEALEDWPAALREAESLDRWQAGRGGTDQGRRPVRAWPWMVAAQARSGDLAGAERLAARLPDDCYLCLRTRALVAALAGRHREAEMWYGRAAGEAPSLPFAYAEWGRARALRGDVDGAIPLFRRAAELAPRWADPLRYWGEALAARASSRNSRSEMEQALPYYQRAAERAPRWGGLHMAWGRALWRLGRFDEAEAKFRAASNMDLSRSDRARVRQILAQAATIR